MKKQEVDTRSSEVFELLALMKKLNKLQAQCLVKLSLGLEAAICNVFNELERQKEKTLFKLSKVKSEVAATNNPMSPYKLQPTGLTGKVYGQPVDK